jgi:hypothetical protein
MIADMNNSNKFINELMKQIYVDVFGISSRGLLRYDIANINWPMAWILNHGFMNADILQEWAESIEQLACTGFFRRLVFLVDLADVLAAATASEEESG